MRPRAVQAAAHRRRDVLMQAGACAAALTAGLLADRTAFAAATASAGQDAAAGFEATSLGEAMRSFGGLPIDDAAVELTTPDVAENGAVVPVSVASRLPGTREIAIVVDGNPNPLVVRFTVAAGTEPFVATRIRMARSGRVYAVVTADGGLFGASRHTTVTVGGCGA